MIRFVLVATLALACVHAIPQGKNASTDARLGLLASSLGVPPVPGASYGGGEGTSYSGGEGTAYSGGGGDGGDYGGGQQVNPIVPLKQCKCVPKQNCLDQNAGGSVYPQPPPLSGGGGGPDYGGQQGGGGGGGPDYGGQQGGGLVDPGYPGGNNGGGQHGGNGGGPEPGYGGTDGVGTDGAGLIDIRIVNKPPGGVVCLSGQVYCCQQGQTGGPYPGPGPQPGPGPYPAPGPGPYPQNPGGCGVRKFIDVPGYKLDYGQAQFGAYPWMAVMLGPSNNYIGAGALIDSYHVLTAAHKVADYKETFKVRFGEWNAQEDSEPFKNVEIGVARIEVHPAFNSQNLQNDVAIITLANPVSLDSYPHIKSACLPTQGSSYVGQRCYVAGFGKDAFQVGKHSYILREVDVPVVESNECEQRLRGTRLGNYFNLNRKSFLCAGGEEGKDACTGDGGSPLVCEYNGRFNVVGLVAWGIGCADYGIPGVYVNVPNYVNWIESKLTGNNQPYPSNPQQPSY